jgi:acyl-homoserine lactone acylase PvdQ
VTDPTGHPGKYHLDGVWRDFELDTTTRILVQGDAQLNEMLTICETVFGPVVTPIVDDCKPEPAIGVGTGCTNGAEYSLKAVPFAVDDQDAFKGYLAMYRAADVVNFMRATEGLIWPSMNMVVASSSGSIAYIANGACPIRKANEFLAGFMALNGDTVANDWQTFLPHGLKPWVLDPAADFLVSANHRPIGAWYPLRSLYPGTGDTTRSRRLREVLEGASIFTPAAFADIHQDRVLPTGRDFALLGKYLRDVQGYPLSANAQLGLRSLIAWQQAGAHMDVTAGGVAVAHFLRRTLRDDWAGPSLLAAHGGGEAGMSHFLRSAIHKITSVPPQNLAADEAAAVAYTLDEAQSSLPAAAGTSSASMLLWYQDQFLLGTPSPTTGEPFAYGKQQEGFPAWDPTLSLSFGPLLASDGATNLSQKADSFTQFVRPGLTDGASSVLPLGISEHRTSPHFTDQRTLWESGQLKAAPWTLAGVQATGPTQTTNLTYP